MKDMLESVYNYNSRFLLDEEQEKLMEKTIFSMTQIDRKLFADNEERAYDDLALPIGHHQTISQPSTVARMIITAELQPGDDVLEIGTGSGWNACLMQFLVYPGNVTSIERIAKLKEKAEANIIQLKGFLNQKKQEHYQKIKKLAFHAENIFEKGSARKRKYNKIIFTAGISTKKQEEKIEELADELLKKEGILVCPRVSGKMIILKKEKELKKFETKEEYLFVPLIQTRD